MGNSSSSSSTNHQSSSNNHSSTSSGSSGGGGHHHNLVNAISKLSSKNTGSLGLSKSELDKRCKPSG